MDWVGRVRWGNVAWLAFVLAAGVVIATDGGESEPGVKPAVGQKTPTLRPADTTPPKRSRERPGKGRTPKTGARRRSRDRKSWRRKAARRRRSVRERKRTNAGEVHEAEETAHPIGKPGSMAPEEPLQTAEPMEVRTPAESRESSEREAAPPPRPPPIDPPPPRTGEFTPDPAP